MPFVVRLPIVSTGTPSRTKSDRPRVVPNGPVRTGDSSLPATFPTVVQRQRAGSSAKPQIRPNHEGGLAAFAQGFAVRAPTPTVRRQSEKTAHRLQRRFVLAPLLALSGSKIGAVAQSQG